jgi:hypothetical protein
MEAFSGRVSTSKCAFRHCRCTLLRNAVAGELRISAPASIKGRLTSLPPRDLHKKYSFSPENFTGNTISNGTEFLFRLLSTALNWSCCVSVVNTDDKSIAV